MLLSSLDIRAERPAGLPRPGRRILKTAAAVFLCLLFYYLRGYRGGSMPAEAAITAIICMQPAVRDTGRYALNRFAGSMIGVVWGLFLLLVLRDFPALSRYVPLVYAMMAAGVLLSLYSAVLLRMPDASGLASIVFLCVVISFPDIEDPLRQAGHRILDVFVGTTIATAVNVVRLPRRKRDDLVVFLRTKDLAPEDSSRMGSAPLFRLNALYADKDRVCLMSEHAPAFFALQMSALQPTVPLIVMDGAALYDANENRYLSFESLPAEDSELLRERLDALGLSYFIYTVHHDRTCVFHFGELSEGEKIVYDRMRRSPYRSYLDGEILDDTEIVYFKLIAPETEIASIAKSLSSVLPESRLRSVIRPQQGSEGLAALYIYARSATIEQAQARLMEILRADGDPLRSLTLKLRSGYRSESDAIRLVQAAEDACEPVIFTRKDTPSDAETRLI